MSDELFEKYLRGAPLSSEEEAALSKILDSDEGQREFVASLESWTLLASTSSKMAAAEGLSQDTPGTPSRSNGASSGRLPRIKSMEQVSPRGNSWWGWGLAASLLLVGGGAYFITEGGDRPEPKTVPLALPPSPAPSGLGPVSGEAPPSSAVDPARSPAPEPERPLPPRALTSGTAEPQRTEREPEDAAPAAARSEPPPIPPASPKPSRAAEDLPPTVTASVTLTKFAGEVYLRNGKGRAPARERQTLSPGDGLATVGAHAQASVRYQDGTVIELAGETEVDSFQDPGSPDPASSHALHLTLGQIRANVSKVPPERPMVVTTPQASIRILGTRFLLEARADLTALEVTEGRVRLTRLEDGGTVDVPAGSTALAGRGIPLFALSTRGMDGRSFPLGTEVATRRGIDFLLRRGEFGSSKQRKDELVLLALLGAGLPEDHPLVQELLKKMLDEPLEKTYLVALQAVILEDLDRGRYQVRIAQCAQFLVDNLCRNGQWDYGTPSIFVENVLGAAGGIRPAESSAAKPREGDPTGVASRPAAKATRRISIQKRKEGPSRGDNSNSQYAALGLRSASDAGILLPREVLLQARRWWAESQQPERKDRDVGVAGWSYGGKEDFHPYGSMTAGGAAALAIYDSLLEGSWQSDRPLQKAVEWIARHFTVSINPGPAEVHAFGGENRFYYLYALARLGTGCGFDAFGGQDWYGKGCAAILSSQKEDGSWKEDDTVCDTCYSILFLRRAMRPLLPERELRAGGKK
ncbi:MAG TPA: FecR domain-containing protein [Planctomycetota bacterium]|nr:FecR domain-containing protein [Planctomycetota bacterium]